VSVCFFSNRPAVDDNRAGRQAAWSFNRIGLESLWNQDSNTILSQICDIFNGHYGKKSYYKGPS
jgi:hypothetical protein